MDTIIYTGKEAEIKCQEILISESSSGNIMYPKYLNTAGYWENGGGTYTAYDNTYGDCWVEVFRTLEAAKAWAECEDEKFWINDKLS